MMKKQAPEEIALKRIEECAQNKTIELDLSNLGLTSIPSSISKLSHLESLDLRNNKISVISEICHLRELEVLRLGHASPKTDYKEYEDEYERVSDQIEDEFNLSSYYYPEKLGNKITKLDSQIANLQKLRVLDVSGNPIKLIPSELFQLTLLEELDLSYSNISEIPKEIINLTKLHFLGLSGTNFEKFPSNICRIQNLKTLCMWGQGEITEIPDEIGNLKNLISLHMWGSGVKKISNNIGKLKNLRILDFGGNKLSSLPLGTRQLENLRILFLTDNLLPIPPEILEKPEEPLGILNYYFSLISGKQKPINETKIIIVGQGSVGKTSLVRQITLGDFDVNEIKTEGISINRWQVQNRIKYENQFSPIQINLWDFGGQEIMHATHQFFLTKRSLYLLALDSRLTQEENRVEYWLKIIQSFGGESPVLIVGNKIDQHPLDIDRTGLQKKYPNIVGILETSAATGKGIEELKTAIAEQVNNLPHVRDLLPETWFTVKTKLEKMGHGTNFITNDDYDKLCDNNDVNGEISQHTLIGFLHDLGVVLYFQDDPRLESLGILNPQWVTNGVYKILNSHTLFQNKGVLTTSMLDEILNLPEYPRGKRLFIVDMMKKFELCYDIEADKTFLVPDLLPKDYPAELKFNGVPAFEYAYIVLPSSVITRFIVRMNQKIDDGLVWRTGVVLKIGENLALVKADIEDRKITIAVDGLEHTRRDALSAIRYQLDEIHASIKGLDVQKRVPIPEAPNAEPLDYDFLLQLERDGEHQVLPVKDGSRLVKVNVRKLLSGVVMTRQINKPEVIHEQSIVELLKIGESATLEYKSTLQWDVKQNTKLAGLRKQVLKTIAAFLNSSGGILVIGVEDNGNIFGLENDLAITHNSTDKFMNLLSTLITDEIGVEFAPLIKIRIEPIDSKQVCVIDVYRAPQPAYMKSEKGSDLYVRFGPTTRLLDTEEAVNYVNMNWK
jgi:internalin A